MVTGSDDRLSAITTRPDGCPVGIGQWSCRRSRDPQAVGGVEQPTSGQRPLGRPGNPRHLVSHVRLLASNRGHLLLGAGHYRRCSARPVGDWPPDAWGLPQAMVGQMLLETPLCGLTDGDSVAPEQQRGPLGREQLGDWRGRFLVQLGDGRPSNRPAGPRWTKFAMPAAILLEPAQPRDDQLPSGRPRRIEPVRSSCVGRGGRQDEQRHAQGWLTDTGLKVSDGGGQRQTTGERTDDSHVQLAPSRIISALGCAPSR